MRKSPFSRQIKQFFFSLALFTQNSNTFTAYRLFLVFFRLLVVFLCEIFVTIHAHRVHIST